MDRLLRLRDEVVGAVGPVGVERVDLEAAADRWLAADACAVHDAPPHTCAAMDGYAVRSDGEVGSRRCVLQGAIYAGDAPPPPLAPGEAARIFTGAPLPPGADAVVPQEAARSEPGAVELSGAIRPGDHVRRAGEDVAAGALALAAGTRLGPRQLALLAAVGAEQLVVRRRPRILVLATGDEIASGRTPDSNGRALAGLCRALGAEVTSAVVEDDAARVRTALERARDADAVVTVGGVSVGERDLVPGALEALGARIHVHGVPMKPGKPFLFAELGAVPVLGLPGSPSACLAAFEVFARPALLALCGAGMRLRRALPLRLAEPLPGRPGRVRLVWAAFEPGGAARPLGRDAAQVRGPALADLLLLVPAGAGALPAGAEVAAWLLDDA